MTYTPPPNTAAITIPTYTGGNSPGILGYYAQQAGTTVDELYKLNQGNPSVRSPNTILAGGKLYLPNQQAPAQQTQAPTTQASKTVVKEYPNSDGSKNVVYSDGTSSFIPAPTSSTTNTTNPTITSDSYRSSIEALNKGIEEQRTSLAKRRDETVARLKAEFDAAAQQQKLRQDKDYAGTSTKLVTSGGGFLGYTGSQGGVLNNLSATFEQEKQALMEKREAAIAQAENAFSENDFKLAQEKLRNAKDLEQELYNRQKDAADMALKEAQNKRAQGEYDRGYTEELIDGYSTLSDEEFSKVSADKIADIDKLYFPGYTVQARKLAQAAAKGKSIENDLKFKSDLQTLINKTPAGQRFTIDGKQYVGMKKMGGGTSTKGMIPSELAYQLGVPSLAGKDESDIILSLSFNNPPQWYKEYYQSSNPELYSKLTKDQLEADWKIFTNQPDIQAYKNSSTVSKRIESANSGVNISAADIASALNDDE